MDAFCRLLFEFHFEPLKDFDELRANPRESVLVVLGDTRCLENDFAPGWLSAFVQQGGAVLVATDKEDQGPARKELVGVSGVTVSGETFVLQTESADKIYGDSMYCPFVVPVAAPQGLGGLTNVLGGLAAVVGGDRPELFRKLHPDQQALRVATNSPSRLVGQGWWLPGGVQRLARLPHGSEDERDAQLHRLGIRILVRDGVRVEKEAGRRRGPLFAVGGSLGEGRVLVLADHSVFINRMILPRDNGNLEFTANCLHWLRGGPSTPLEALAAAQSRDVNRLAGQRHKVLFVDDGTVRTNFRVPMKEVPVTPPAGAEPAIVAAVDQTLARMEDNDVFNRKLLEQIDWDLPGGRGRLVRGALYLVTLAACLLLGYRVLWRGRHRVDPTVPLLEPAVARHEPKAALLEQRRRAVLRSGNVWETVHQLARQSFESAGVPLTGQNPPRVAVRGGWWRRWRVGRRVARLWRLARGGTPHRIPPAALKRWLAELDELKALLAEGGVGGTRGS